MYTIVLSIFLLCFLFIESGCNNGGGPGSRGTSILGSDIIDPSGTATIDGNFAYQIIEGWGINHHSRNEDWWVPDPQYPIPAFEVMNQIKNDLGIDFVFNYSYNLLELQNDNDDPYVFNWDSINMQFSDHSVYFEDLKVQQDAGLLLAAQSIMGCPSWMSDNGGNFDGTIPNVYEELGEYWAAFIIYAKNNYGLDIPLITIQNEPSSPHHCVLGPNELKEAVKVVGNRLRQEGFDTLIMAPNDAEAVSSQSMSQVLINDPIAKSYLPNISYHLYDNDSSVNGPDVVISSLTNLADDPSIRNSDLSLWMTEWCMFLAYGDRLYDWIDTLRLALDHTKMIYNTHEYGNTALYTIWDSEYDWEDGTHCEGIFGPGVSNGKLNMKKLGHMQTQYTKYVRPGAQRIDVWVSGSTYVFVTAYKHNANNQFTIEALNKGATDESINFNLNNISVTSLNVIRTSAAENSSYLGAIETIGNNFIYTLPRESLTTFTNMQVDPDFSLPIDNSFVVSFDSSHTN